MATFQDKLDRIVESWTRRTGLVNVIPGSTAYGLAESTAYEQLQIERLVEKSTKAKSLLDATGFDLDEIGGQFFGVERRKEIKPFVTSDMKVMKFYVKSGTFGSINSGGDIVIPEGVMLEGLSGGTTVRFRTTQQVTLPSFESEMYVSAELIQGPSDPISAWAINKHYFKGYSQAMSETLLVINPVVIGTGRAKESDDNYRYRLTNALRAFAKTNTAGIHATVTDLPGVSDAVILPAANGGGTFTVYVQSVSPETPDTLVDDATMALLQNAGPWVEYNILKPNYIGLQMDLVVTTRNPDTYALDDGFKHNIQDAVSNYVNNYFGADFYLMDILKLVENLHDDILDAQFASLKIYRGSGKFRKFNQVDLLVENNPIIYISNIEKVIIEPVANPITVAVE